jgi:hypothetical protein
MKNFVTHDIIYDRTCRQICESDGLVDADILGFLYLRWYA